MNNMKKNIKKIKNLNKKLVFIDIDGTLTRDDGSMSLKTKNVLRIINEKYNNIILTSGRARNDVKNICDELKLKYFISSNGSEIYDNEKNNVLYSKTINSQIVRKLINIAKVYNVEVKLAINDNEVVIRDKKYYNDYDDVKQCMFKGDDEILLNIRKHIEQIENVYIPYDNNQYEFGYYWFSVLPLNVSKGNAVSFLAKYLNYKKSNLVAIGNDYNDISMFHNVGNGLAVGNACEELKKIAKKVIGNNNEDGVKKILEKYIDQKEKKMEDIRLMIGDVKFSARAVAIIKKNGKILFQKRKTDEYWALPGGAITTLERGKDVVIREICEETGEKKSKVIRPIWFSEYFFRFDGKKQHQYIFGYLVDIPDDSKLLKMEKFDGIEKEKNIVYKWFDVKDLKNSPIKPNFLKNKLSLIKESFEYIEENDL